MIPLLIAAGFALAALIAYLVVVTLRSRDPLDRRVTRARASEVLKRAVASVPANAFDARLRIVRSQT